MGSPFCYFVTTAIPASATVRIVQGVAPANTS